MLQKRKQFKMTKSHDMSFFKKDINNFKKLFESLSINHAKKSIILLFSMKQKTSEKLIVTCIIIFNKKNLF